MGDKMTYAVAADPIETIGRLRQAALALEMQYREGARPHCRRKRNLPLNIALAIILPLAAMVAWAVRPGVTEAMATAGALVHESTFKGPSPFELRRRELAADGSQTLADNIAGYYARIPGGFDVAVAAAESASRQRRLREYPSLRYELLHQPVPVRVVDKLHEDEKSKTLGQYIPVENAALIRKGLSPARAQEVLEHELTHAWQGISTAPGQSGAAGSLMSFMMPLGNAEAHEQIISCIFFGAIGKEGRLLAFMRGYLCRPVEIDARLAAFKRLWAWNHGELLDDPERIRQAFEHPRGGDLGLSTDFGDAVRIWDSYRNQPDVQELLVQRVMQLL